MLILARDPGQKPGVVVLDAPAAPGGRPTLVWAGLVPPNPGVFISLDDVYDVAVTEGQWWYPSQDTSPNRLFRLAFEAGWGLRGIPAARYMCLLPQVWRRTSQDKPTVQRIIAKSLTIEERKLFKGIPKTRHGDVLDAIGIGRGAYASLNTTQYDWPPR